MFFRREKRIRLDVDSMDCRILIRALLLLKESQIQSGKAYDSIDSLIVKLCELEND